VNDATIVVLIGLGALTLYALFGGADFGGGVWDVLASGPRRDAQRAAIAHAMGPVWETNHVWLIFAIVLLFTCFPAAFAALSVGLYVPLTFVLVGIILRGAAFVFRSQARGAERPAEIWGSIFGVASVIAPFFFGTAAGGLAIGNFDWRSPFALAIGVFAVALCSQIAAVFLTLETGGALQGDFRSRALAATIAAGIAAAIVPVIAAVTAPTTFAALTSRTTLIDIALTMAAGVLVLAALWIRHFALARVLVALETIGILLGWYISQAGFIIPGMTTPAAAAAPAATLRVFIWIVGIGALFLVPSLLLLFGLFKASRSTPESGSTP
jgi:cytochrome d ubiquinol oxidase subunit II